MQELAAHGMLGTVFVIRLVVSAPPGAPLGPSAYYERYPQTGYHVDV